MATISRRRWMKISGIIFLGAFVITAGTFVVFLQRYEIVEQGTENRFTILVKDGGVADMEYRLKSRQRIDKWRQRTEFLFPDLHETISRTENNVPVQGTRVTGENKRIELLVGAVDDGAGLQVVVSTTEPLVVLVVFEHQDGTSWSEESPISVGEQCFVVRDEAFDTPD